MTETTTLQKCWYHYYTGKQNKREHLEFKLFCTKCHLIWDKQGFAFHFCSGCGRYITEIEEDREDG